MFLAGGRGLHGGERLPSERGGRRREAVGEGRWGWGWNALIGCEVGGAPGSTQTTTETMAGGVARRDRQDGWRRGGTGVGVGVGCSERACSVVGLSGYVCVCTVGVCGRGGWTEE
jgi:hypothetical protein